MSLVFSGRRVSFPMPALAVIFWILVDFLETWGMGGAIVGGVSRARRGETGRSTRGELETRGEGGDDMAASWKHTGGGAGAGGTIASPMALISRATNMFISSTLFCSGIVSSPRVLTKGVLAEGGEAR